MHPWLGTKNFRYLIPKESYGHNTLAVPRGRCDGIEQCEQFMDAKEPNIDANMPITGFLDCQIRHDANSYGRHYWGPYNTHFNQVGLILSPIHTTKTAIILKKFER